MKLVTITLQFLADDEASARRRAERILGEHNDCRFAEPTIEDASLDDEDEILGTERAAAMRCMDALRRTSMPLLIEVAKEVRDGPHNASANGFADDEESLRAHLHDLYTSRVHAALDAEFGDLTDEQREAAMEAVVDWAFGPIALDDVWLDEDDCAEVMMAYIAVWGGSGPPLHEENIRKFCYDGELESRVPRLAAMADDAYGWLKDCSEAGAWLPSPASLRPLEIKIEESSPTCPGCAAFKARDCQCEPVWSGFWPGDGPRYAQPLHDCELAFLGRRGEHDMYFCAKHQEYVARFGDDEESYVSADVELAGVHRVLKHAVAMRTP